MTSRRWSRASWNSIPMPPPRPHTARALQGQPHTTQKEKVNRNRDTTAPAAPAPKLVAPRPAYRQVRGQARAQLSFWMKAAPKGPVEFEILDDKKVVVKKL